MAKFLGILASYRIEGVDVKQQSREIPTKAEIEAYVSALVETLYSFLHRSTLNNFPFVLTMRVVGS